MTYKKATIRICKEILQGEPQYGQVKGYTVTMNNIKFFTNKISTDYWITREYKTGFEIGTTYAKTRKESLNKAINTLIEKGLFNSERLNNFIKTNDFKQINF